MRRSSTACGSTPWRQSPSTNSGTRSRRRARFCHKVANWPVSYIKTWSPGDSVFTNAASQAPVPDADGKQEKINLKPANLVLAEGSAVVATGLTGAPELNGQRGIVEGWLEEKGRYAVRLEDKRRKKLANLRPENCRADVLAL